MARKSDDTRLPQLPHQPSSQAQEMAGISRDTGPADSGRKRMPGRSSEDAPRGRGRRRATGPGPGAEAARTRSVDRPRKQPPQAGATTAED